jgi:flagellin
MLAGAPHGCKRRRIGRGAGTPGGAPNNDVRPTALPAARPPETRRVTMAARDTERPRHGAPIARNSGGFAVSIGEVDTKKGCVLPDPGSGLLFFRSPTQNSDMGFLSLRNTTNATATARQVGRSQGELDEAQLRLASGLRINRAADDASGLAMSERMRAQIGGLTVATRNAKDAIAVAQTADGVLAEVGNILQRIRSLAVQSVNDVNTTAEREALQGEVSAMQTEIARLAASAEFGGQKLLDGSFVGKRFLVGANAGQEVTLSIGGIGASSLASGTAVTDGSITSAVPLAAAVFTGTNNVAAQTLSLVGPDGTGSASVGAGDDAGTIAARINLVSATTGISASAATNVRVASVAPASNGTAATTMQLSTKSGGVQTPIVIVSGTIGVGGNLSSIVSQVNALTGTTGVTAALGASSNEMILTSSTGADIILGDVLANDAAGPASLLSATGLRTNSAGALVTSGVAVPMAGRTGAIVGGSLSLSANGAVSVTTTATGTLFSTATTAGSSTSLGALNIGTVAGANAAINVVDDALDTVNAQRATLGAFENRLDSTIAALETTIENVTLARSRITDADVAAEAANVARARVLVEAGVSVLAQANQSPRMALKLLTETAAA